MRKIFLSFLFILFIFVTFSQNPISTSSKTVKLILVHPTEYNLKLFTYLIDNKIICVENLEIIGVYHKNEVYNYTQSEIFLEKQQIKYIQLHGISNDIFQDDLYKLNKCTDTFYKLFNNSNGILFFGGPDLPPTIYNEETSLLTEISDPYRHYFEASFLFHLLGGNQNAEFKPFLENNQNYTVYGICLGMQTMNIATGGTLIQDIPSEVYQINSVEQELKTEKNTQHRNYYNNISIDSLLFPGSFHEIQISNSKPFIGDEIVKNNPLVYSNHHQAIEELGKDLQIIATSIDGEIIEAINHKKYPNVLGIQFHPEGIYLHNPEIKYKITPNDSIVSGFEILKNHESYDFHLAFWKEFSKRIKSN